MSQLVLPDSTKLYEALLALKSEVHELRIVIVGNKAFEQEGLAKMVHRHEKVISTFTSKWSILCTIIVIAWTVFATIRYGAR